jgi:hypothetical protein
LRDLAYRESNKSMHVPCAPSAESDGGPNAK